MEATELTARELIATWAPGRIERHRKAAVCPRCSKDLTKIGITDLVYAYEPCSCGKPPFEHLVEQLWHRECFVEAKRG